MNWFGRAVLAGMNRPSFFTAAVAIVLACRNVTGVNCVRGTRRAFRASLGAKDIRIMRESIEIGTCEVENE